jgi:hypothetical protein
MPPGHLASPGKSGLKKISQWASFEVNWSGANWSTDVPPGGLFQAVEYLSLDYWGSHRPGRIGIVGAKLVAIGARRRRQSRGFKIFTEWRVFIRPRVKWPTGRHGLACLSSRQGGHFQRSIDGGCNRGYVLGPMGVTAISRQGLLVARKSPF